MPGTTPEGLPYPLSSEPVRDGAVAIQNLAVAAGTAFPLPLNTSAQRIGRVGVMMAAALVQVFDAGGRAHLDTSATFSSVLYVHAVSTTFPVVFSVPNIASPNIELFGQLPNGSNLTGSLTLMVYIVGIRK
jgi:hypothetical protein